MSDSSYTRTRGYRSWMKRRCYRPMIPLAGIATLASGRQYRIEKDGSWRRLFPRVNV